MNKNLEKILQANKDTDCGKRFNFADIQTEMDYKNAVPLTNYDFYNPLVELTTRIGERDIYTGNPLAGYTHTAGTTGGVRLYPCTQVHLDNYIKAFDALDVKGITFLMVESMPKEAKLADCNYVDSITGLVLNASEKKLRDKGILHRQKYTCPQEVMITKEVLDSIHVRLLFALMRRDVEQIVAPFAWGIMEMCQYMLDNYNILLSDMENASLKSDITISDELRARISNEMEKDDKRIAELREIFEMDDKTALLQKIWPKCRRVVAASTGSFEIYRKYISKYLGDIEWCNGYMASSEGIIGRAINGTGEYRLVDTGLFLEFKELTSDKTVMAEDVCIGKCYEVIITNNSGLYRFKSGDIIKIEDVDNGDFTFTYAYRKLNGASIAGEMLDEVKICNAIDDCFANKEVMPADFCYLEDDSNSLYEIFIEADSSNLEYFESADKNQLSEEINASLCKVSKEYSELYSMGKLRKCKVNILQPQTQLLYRDRVKYNRKCAPDQIKPVRKIHHEEQEAFFRKQCI